MLTSGATVNSEPLIQFFVNRGTAKVREIVKKHLDENSKLSAAAPLLPLASPRASPRAANSSSQNENNNSNNNNDTSPPTPTSPVIDGPLSASGMINSTVKRAQTMPVQASMTDETMLSLFVQLATALDTMHAKDYVYGVVRLFVWFYLLFCWFSKFLFVFAYNMCFC